MSVGRRTGDDGKSEMAGAFPFPEFPACFRYSLFPAFKLPAYTAKAAVKAPSEDEKKIRWAKRADKRETEELLGERSDEGGTRGSPIRRP